MPCIPGTFDRVLRTNGYFRQTPLKNTAADYLERLGRYQRRWLSNRCSNRLCRASILHSNSHALCPRSLQDTARHSTEVACTSIVDAALSGNWNENTSPISHSFCLSCASTPSQRWMASLRSPLLPVLHNLSSLGTALCRRATKSTTPRMVRQSRMSNICRGRQTHYRVERRHESITGI
jgi:hypothetical protein